MCGLGLTTRPCILQRLQRPAPRSVKTGKDTTTSNGLMDSNVHITEGTTELTGILAALDSCSVGSCHLGSLWSLGTLDDDKLYSLSIANAAESLLRVVLDDGSLDKVRREGERGRGRAGGTKGDGRNKEETDETVRNKHFSTFTNSFTQKLFCYISPL